jgi:hypothetical protein
MSIISRETVALSFSRKNRALCVVLFSNSGMTTDLVEKEGKRVKHYQVLSAEHAIRKPVVKS